MQAKAATQARAIHLLAWLPKTPLLLASLIDTNARSPRLLMAAPVHIHAHRQAIMVQRLLLMQQERAGEVVSLLGNTQRHIATAIYTFTQL